MPLTPRQIIEKETEGLQALAGLSGEVWASAVKLITETRGRVVVCGLGKSGLVGQKWAATFSSLGTASVFLHAAEALHGDLGLLREYDLVFCISNSGSTPEVVAVAAFAHRNNIRAVAVTKNADSPLAQNCQLTLLLPITEEADPLGLAPTTSTTATLVMGDVLAILAAQEKNFSRSDFGRVHPGGALGQATRQGGPP